MTVPLANTSSTVILVRSTGSFTVRDRCEKLPHGFMESLAGAFGVMLTESVTSDIPHLERIRIRTDALPSSPSGCW